MSRISEYSLPIICDICLTALSDRSSLAKTCSSLPLKGLNVLSPSPITFLNSFERCRRMSLFCLPRKFSAASP